MRKKICALLSCLALAACSNTTPVETSTVSQDSSEATYRIGVIQYMEHPSLDDATQGFIDGLAQLGYVDGENISLDQNNAQGDSGNSEAIVNKFVNDSVDLIFANATPAAQSAANKTSDIPIILTSVTDPQASGLVESNDAPGVNVSGTSDLADMSTQIGIITDLLPNAKTVGVMYCSAEQNSVYQAKLAKETLESLGLEYKEFTVSDSTYVQSVAQSVIGQVDVLFVPTDNLMAESISTITTIMQDANIPVVGGFSDVATQGGLAAYGVNYYQLGVQAAQMAVDVLEGNASIESLPIGYLEKEGYELVINQSVADQLNVEISQDLLDQAIVIE